MDSVEMLQESVTRDPGDDAAWLALADALEERDDPRGQPTRLCLSLRRQLDHPEHPVWEQQLRDLVKGNMRVCLPRRVIPLGRGVEMSLVLVPPGSFWMGSPESEPERQTDERRHLVTLTRGYWIGIHTVTQAQWKAVRPDNPSQFRGDSLPVEQVNWGLSVEFCQQLSEHTGRAFSLPTEAQWEYACRAGTSTPFHCGPTISPAQANYDGNYTYGEGVKGVYREKTTPVGSFPANAWGLFDTHGNLCEWCQNFVYPYPSEPVQDPGGPQEGNERVLRGGSWYTYPRRCRSAFRYVSAPGTSFDVFGLRVVLALE